MHGIAYQLKSVLKDKFCLMTFLLPLAAAAALHFAGSIDLSSLGELHFAVLEKDLPRQTTDWLRRYGAVTACENRTELTAAIAEPSTNVIGVMADGPDIRTIIAGDELDIFQQAAGILPALYAQRHAAAAASVQTLERPDILAGFSDIFPSAVLLMAMFMGCTFNAMNILSEKEDGVALINEILPITPGQYIFQKIAVGFLFGCLSSVATACICFRLSGRRAGLMLAFVLLASFVAALMGLFIGRLSRGLMDGVVYIKIVLLLFLTVPILYTLTGVNGPLAALCYLTPSQPAFAGIRALNAGNTGVCVRELVILASHCAAWVSLYVLLSIRRKK